MDQAQVERVMDWVIQQTGQITREARLLKLVNEIKVCIDSVLPYLRAAADRSDFTIQLETYPCRSILLEVITFPGGQIELLDGELLSVSWGRDSTAPGAGVELIWLDGELREITVPRLNLAWLEVTEGRFEMELIHYRNTRLAWRTDAPSFICGEFHKIKAVRLRRGVNQAKLGEILAHLTAHVPTLWQRLQGGEPPPKAADPSVA